ncbi:MAG: UDP-N-acetylmuramoyl-L-alanyl-D-glutamate--2,6-diaminopimelate ligase [Phycisphaeraceae bacterium]|nr:UDP-N-acetylmuramoyl-L-alanyl-D-glutamate--2,6-diaminopimelate ligase [Phycisphaeraceae bacterium]
MLISQLIQALPITLVRGDRSLQVSDVCEDSRLASSGCLFIARGGTQTDGSQFIADAVTAGAVAVLCAQIPDNLPEHVTVLQSQTVDTALTATVADRFFDHPSTKLRLVGVTGTNGKTTTAYLIRRLIRRSGVMCGMIGTIEIDDGIERTTAELTTPGSVELARLLAKMVDNGCAAAVMEVSSHALDQGRIAALQFHTAVFTNLTGDHLDYHGTMANYAAAKAKLFEMVSDKGWAIVNGDDPYASQMLEQCKARQLHCHVTETSPVEKPQDIVETGKCIATILQMTSARSYARMAGPWGSYELEIPLIGRHNLYNTIQAIAAANTITPVARKLRPTLEQAKGVPGRLELVTLDDAPDGVLPAVLVDYAHTHDALENVLSAIRPLCLGKLICVFGCGGDRDVSKRPKMAKIACDYSDIAIITNDNPRTENPFKIIDDIQAGIPKQTACDVRIIDDRKAAIEQAIALADANDTVLIAGKGHEDYQILGTEKTHFDDREVARDVLMKGLVIRD